MSSSDGRTAEQASVNAFADFSTFPLLQALEGRRSRRFGRGMEIPDGPLAYRSQSPPQPLTDTERALLVLTAAGVSGWSTGMEHTVSGPGELGCNYPIRLPGRTRPSAAGCGASELLVTDDAGTFITQFRDVDPDELATASSAGVGALPEIVSAHSVRISDDRVEVPRTPPMTSPHNIWNANVPGSTLFVPVVDLSQQLLNFTFIYMQSGFLPWDSVADVPCGDQTRAIQAGLLDSAKRFSMQDFEQYVLVTAGAELAIMAYNAVLAMQAMGLGGWMFTGIDPPALLGARAAHGVPGAGFEFVSTSPGAPPSCVGLRGAFESFSPPWYQDMDAAVAAFVDRKFGASGTYDPVRQGPWKDKSVMGSIERYEPALVDAVTAVASYMYETYGRFPSVAPTVYARIYAQAHHVEQEFYEEFYGEEFLLDTHRAHNHLWHGPGTYTENGDNDGQR
jgi:hypothetical protein